MNKLPGSAFFVAAAILLAITKSPDMYTILAVVGCAAAAGLSLSKHSQWSVVGGGFLIAVSLTLQAVLSYRCLDCIRADLLILAGTVLQALVAEGRHKNSLRIMTGAMAALMLLNGALHFPAPLNDNSALTMQAEKIGRFIEATEDGRAITLDSQIKPVLFYSPNCGACQRVVEALAKLDPEGKRWSPAQVGGDPGEGKSYLTSIGYRGLLYQHSWDGAVPALFTTKGGKTEEFNGLEEIIRIVRGGSG